MSDNACCAAERAKVEQLVGDVQAQAGDYTALMGVARKMRAALEYVKESCETSFIRCNTCGDQEDLADVDFAEDVRLAVAAARNAGVEPERTTETAAHGTSAVPIEQTPAEVAKAACREAMLNAIVSAHESGRGWPENDRDGYGAIERAIQAERDRAAEFQKARDLAWLGAVDSAMTYLGPLGMECNCCAQLRVMMATARGHR